MDAINSFESYTKADALKDQAYWRSTHKRLIIISLSIIVLIMILIGALLGTLVPMKTTKSKENIPSPTYTSSAESINAICNVTLYPASCKYSIASLESSLNNTDPNPSPEELFKLSMQVALNELMSLYSLPKKLVSSSSDYSNINNDPVVQEALRECEVLIEDAVHHVNQSITSIQVGPTTSMINDIRTWLSTAITDQVKCLDGIPEAVNYTIFTEEMRYAMRNSTEFTSNSLVIASNIMTNLPHFHISVHRKLLTVDDDCKHCPDDDFPGRIRNGCRRLLQEKNPRSDLTVVKDGRWWR